MKPIPEKSKSKAQKARESIDIRRRKLRIQELNFLLQQEKAMAALQQVACERTKLDLEEQRVNLKEAIWMDARRNG